MADCIEPTSCHAYSSSMKHLALSPNNDQIIVYQSTANGWTQESILEQHDMRVTGIDWAPKTDRIVTCSADRNAYVWTRSAKTNEWQPTLVLLRINRAATSVKWSPNEQKFAVATGAKLVCVCHFDSANDWWVSKHIKKPIKSTVTCLDWHPDNLLLACGSTDYKARIFSTFIKEVDKDSVNKLQSSTWMKLQENGHTTIDTSQTGALIGEFSNSGAWVHDVAFSADGSVLAWVSHDCSVSIVNSLQGMTVITLKTRYLPFFSCAWMSPTHIVAAGHDCCPMLFSYDAASQKIQFVTRLDQPQREEVDGFSAMRKFKEMDTRASVRGDTASTPAPISELGCLNLKCSRTQASIRVLI